MKTVFISGSRHLSKLTEQVKERLLNIINQNFHVVLGDANGMDKAVQAFLFQQGYNKVTVYCSGNGCRNNLGLWPVQNIAVSKNLKGREFYTIKDRAMAKVADYGLVLWDGKSKGSYNNMLELIQYNKKSLLYFAPTKSFLTISNAEDLAELKANKNNQLDIHNYQQALSL